MDFKEKIKTNANMFFQTIYSKLNYMDIFLAFNPYCYHLYICKYLEIEENEMESDSIPKYYNWEYKCPDNSKKYAYTGYKRDETVLGVIQLFSTRGSIFQKIGSFENMVLREFELINRLQEDAAIEAANNLREGIVEMMASMELNRDNTSWVILFDSLPSERYTRTVSEINIRFIPSQPQPKTITLMKE